MSKYLKCDFCGKDKNQVRAFITGSSAFICDECILLGVNTLTDGKKINADSLQPLISKIMRPGKDFVGSAAIFICHDGEGNYLLCKRGENCRDEQGTWGPGGGVIEFHDRIEERLRKEVLQEFCTDVLSYEFLGYRDIHQEDGAHWIGLDFKVLVDRSKVKNGEPHKLDDIGWFRLGDFPEPFHSQFPIVLSMYKDKL